MNTRATNRSHGSSSISQPRPVQLDVDEQASSQSDCIPGQAEFGDGEETESFYITLDVTASNVILSSTHQTGLGSKEAAFDNDDSDDESDNQSEPAATTTTATDKRKRRAIRRTTPMTEPVDDDDEEQQVLREKFANRVEVDGSKVQILDLAQERPVIKYRNRIYECRWMDVVGTEMFFVPPESGNERKTENAKGKGRARDDGNGEEGNAQDSDDDEEDEEGQGNSQAQYLGKSRIRLEGLKTTVKAKDMIETKQEIADIVNDFEKRFQVAKEKRKEREEGVSKSGDGGDSGQNSDNGGNGEAVG